jgi:hypothetical protein
MKRVIAVLAVLVALVPAARDAHALGAYATWWHASDEDGFGVGVRQSTPVTANVSIDTRAAYVNLSDSDTRIFPLEVVGIASLGSLYGGLGVGYYIFDTKQGNADNSFGWHVLAGLQIALHHAGIFGEIKWTQLSTDIKGVDVNLKNVPHHIDADGVGFNAGIAFGI